jgi:hypothetical protein
VFNHDANVIMPRFAFGSRDATSKKKICPHDIETVLLRPARYLAMYRRYLQWPTSKPRSTTEVPLPLLSDVAHRREYYFDSHI